LPFLHLFFFLGGGEQEQPFHVISPGSRIQGRWLDVRPWILNQSHVEDVQVENFGKEHHFGVTSQTVHVQRNTREIAQVILALLKFILPTNLFILHLRREVKASNYLRKTGA
jgi:hypothetical protein